MTPNGLKITSGDVGEALLEILKGRHQTIPLDEIETITQSTRNDQRTVTHKRNEFKHLGTKAEKLHACLDKLNRKHAPIPHQDTVCPLDSTEKQKKHIKISITSKINRILRIMKTC